MGSGLFLLWQYLYQPGYLPGTHEGLFRHGVSPFVSFTCEECKVCCSKWHLGNDLEKAYTIRTHWYGKLEWHQDSPVAQRLVVDWISWYSILAPHTHPLSYSGQRLKYIYIWSFCIKSFFNLGRFFCLQIRKVWSMFGFGFEFGYGPLSSNFWIVLNSVRQDLALLEFVWIFLKCQTWALACTPLTFRFLKRDHLWYQTDI